ncbi:hypothetical protein [Sphingobacterium sp. MYb382]|uniref:hypothetical protein n=1 Tax=Sphingobacterium sp. MYb382 TaxID=2745278 RepID=UPI0030B2FF0F
MWSLILYLLFGIGHPAQTPASHPTMQTTSVGDNQNPGGDDEDNEDGVGGDKGNIRPPKK